MQLFGSFEVNPEVIPYIQKGEGVGVVKIQNFGKFSAFISNNTVNLISYENAQDILIKIPDISLIQYNEGNFINEPKLTIGVKSTQFVLAGVDNNDEELNIFYQTLLDLRQKQENINTKNNNNSMPHPNKNITNPNKLINKNNNFNQDNIPYDENIQNEDNIQNDNLTSKDPVDEIRRYYELKEEGIISEEEFNKKKEQLLNL